ncbi:PREDICTED: protein CCSMST1, partial [Merops nubicus]|uniref:protein CCSMST1 n=1 Tax=Merops nubicus TaxID=57421 RepID=UPI0004F0C380
GAADAEPECGGAIPFSASKASPRAWRVSQSMGSDHERSWMKVLPLSLLCTGLLLWCVFREKTEIDEQLEAVFSGQITDSLDDAQKNPQDDQWIAMHKRKKEGIYDNELIVKSPPSLGTLMIRHEWFCEY